jgi:hypothetical protein
MSAIERQKYTDTTTEFERQMSAQIYRGLAQDPVLEPLTGAGRKTGRGQARE